MQHTAERTLSRDHLRDLRVFAMTQLKNPALKWRRHGIGLVQAYLHEGSAYFEARLHIWHPSAIRPGIRDHGDIHNHRFDLESTVLTGALEHTEMHFNDSEGGFSVFKCVHAREDIGARYVKAPLWDTGCYTTTAQLRGLKKYVFGEGARYTFEQGAFHQSRAQGLVVTLVTKTNQRDVQARVIAKAGSPPVHAFEAGDDFDAPRVIKEAHGVLLAAVLP